MRTMRLDGVNKAIEGITTIEEVIRLTRSEEIRRISHDNELEQKGNG
jgi:hypothetical protein